MSGINKNTSNCDIKKYIKNQETKLIKFKNKNNKNINDPF